MTTSRLDPGHAKRPASVRYGKVQDWRPPPQG